MREIISFKESIAIVRKRLGVILLLTMIAVVGSILITNYLLTPQFQSQILLLVNQSDEERSDYSSTELHTSLELINTYNVIITSPRILDQVSNQLGLNETHRTLRERVLVRGEGDSQVVSIQVHDKDSEVAMKIANTIGSVFQKEIVDIMQVDNVSVLSPAEMEPDPISPNLSLNIVIGFIVGISASIGFAFLLDFLDNTVRTEEEMEELTGLPVLGSINLMDKKIDVRSMEKRQTGSIHHHRLKRRREKLGS